MQTIFRMFLFSLLLLCGCRLYYLVWSGGATSDGNASHARTAERLRTQGKMEEAIAEYKKHIAARLSEPTRPAGENPYFYWILIGDVYLEADRPEDAKRSYLEARDHDVDIAFVIDRLRGIARYFEQRKEYEEAIKLLKEFRQMDDFIFDYDIDRLSKEMVKAEDEGKRY